MSKENLSEYVHVDPDSGKAFVCIGDDSLDVDELFELRKRMLEEQRRVMVSTMYSLKERLFQLEMQLSNTEKQLDEAEYASKGLNNE